MLYVLLLNLYLYTQCMEIRAANFTQQAWKQKNFILHFAIIFSLYNSPSDMQYRLSINISVAFRAHTFPLFSLRCTYTYIWKTSPVCKLSDKVPTFPPFICALCLPLPPIILPRINYPSVASPSNSGDLPLWLVCR